MRTDRTPDNQWQKLVTELRGSQDEQQHRWGDVDDVLIARFLAGECDEDERAAVERATETFPEVRECIALASETLNDVYSSARVIPATPKRASIGQRIFRFAFSSAVPNWAAAASLLVAIGLGWALVTRLNSLDAQVVALLASRDDSGKSRPVAVASAEVESLQSGLQDLKTRVAELSQQPRVEVPAATAEVQSLQSRLQELKNQVAELAHWPHVEAPAVIEASQTPKDHGTGERVATAVRGFTRLEREVPNVLFKHVQEEITDAQGETRTVARPVYETASRCEVYTLPHDLVDNPPTLPPEELVPGLTHRMELVRWAAADALSRIADDASRTKARAAIVETLSKRDDLGRAAADYVLTGRIAEGFGADLSKAAMEALASPDKIVRWAGLHYFLVVRGCFDDKGPTVVSPTFFEPDFVVRLVRQLVEIARQKDENPLLHKAAVYLLGQFGDGAKPAIDDLIQIVQGDGDPQVRRWAAYAIGQIGVGSQGGCPTPWPDSLGTSVKSEWHD